MNQVRRGIRVFVFKPSLFLSYSPDLIHDVFFSTCVFCNAQTQQNHLTQRPCLNASSTLRNDRISTQRQYYFSTTRFALKRLSSTLKRNRKDICCVSIHGTFFFEFNPQIISLPFSLQDLLHGFVSDITEALSSKLQSLFAKQTEQATKYLDLVSKPFVIGSVAPK